MPVVLQAVLGQHVQLAATIRMSLRSAGMQVASRLPQELQSWDLNQCEAQTSKTSPNSIRCALGTFHAAMRERVIAGNGL